MPHTEQVDVSVHPPFTDLRSVQTLIDADKLPFILGAQHCHWEDKGAFTGEVSPLFLAKLEVRGGQVRFVGGRLPGRLLDDFRDVLSDSAIEPAPVRIVVIAPLGYRLRRGSRLLQGDAMVERVEASERPGMRA